MTSGDIKSEDFEVMKVQAGAAGAIGDVVHIEADGYWDPVVATDTGKFGVLLDSAAAEGDWVRVLTRGDVEVTATAAAIAKGAYAVAGSTGKIAQVGTLDAAAVLGTIIGYAKTAFASGGQGILHVGD